MAVLLSRSLLFLVAVLAASHARAADPQEVEQKLKAALKGKVVTLKKFYLGSHLRYSTDGTLQNSAELCPWTVCSKLSVEGVKIKDNHLILDCRRVIVAFEGKQLAPKHFSIRDSVKIEVVSASGPEEFMQAVANIFLAPGTRLSDLVPPYWHNIVSRIEQGKSIEPGKDETSAPVPPGVFKVGNGVTPPRAIKTPDPPYTEFARLAARTGTLVLWMVVQEDGKVRDVRIVKPVGFGIDDDAVKTVETWEFEPGRKDGQPIPVQVNVEVKFALYR